MSTQYDLVAKRLTEMVRAAELVFLGCEGDPTAMNLPGVQALYNMLFVSGWADGEDNPICTLAVQKQTRGGRNTPMQTSDALKALRAKLAPLHQDADPFVEYNQELGNLAIELGNLTSSRQPTVVFRVNGHDIVLSLAGQAGNSQFMVQTDQVSREPFPLRDAAEFVKLAAAYRIAELATLLLDETNRANEEVRGATATITAVRDALKSV